jgi:hypothetical protein
VGDHADNLDVLLLGETAGDDTAIPPLAEAARIGPHAMHDLDDDFGQSAEAVVGTLDRERRQRLLAPATQCARGSEARLGGDRNALGAVPPGSGPSHP